MTIRVIIKTSRFITGRIAYVSLGSDFLSSHHSAYLEALRPGSGRGRVSTLEACALFLREAAAAVTPMPGVWVNPHREQQTIPQGQLDMSPALSPPVLSTDKLLDAQDLLAAAERGLTLPPPVSSPDVPPPVLSTDKSLDTPTAPPVSSMGLPPPVLSTDKSLDARGLLAAAERALAVLEPLVDYVVKQKEDDAAARPVCNLYMHSLYYHVICIYTICNIYIQ